MQRRHRSGQRGGRYDAAVLAQPRFAKVRDADAARQFVDYATQKGVFALGYSRGMDPRVGAE